MFFMNTSLVKNYYKCKQQITSSFDYDSGMNDEAKNFARNLKILMEHHQDTQSSLHKRSRVSQKTISNMLNPGDDSSPNLANIEKIAKAYNLKTWHLLLPNPPQEILINSSIEKFVENYTHADKKTREAWASVAEATAKYIKTIEDPSEKAS
jgi:transcriptional regulator with XRE-family HTH domain